MGRKVTMEENENGDWGRELGQVEKGEAKICAEIQRTGEGEEGELERRVWEQRWGTRGGNMGETEDKGLRNGGWEHRTQEQGSEHYEDG